ncbi:MAG: DUF6034 family protein, partial [Clostridia bacterium]|nr:DUF6034 family protein [Clostridia bacterium]
PFSEISGRIMQMADYLFSWTYSSGAENVLSRDVKIDEIRLCYKRVQLINETRYAFMPVWVVSGSVVDTSDLGANGQTDIWEVERIRGVLFVINAVDGSLVERTWTEAQDLQ